MGEKMSASPRIPIVWETAGLGLMVVSGTLIWIIMNGILNNSPYDKVSWFGGLHTFAISLFWIALVLYHVGLIGIASRSIIVNEKNTGADFTAFAFGMLGMMLIIISLLGFFYFRTNPILWFWNLTAANLFYAGIVIEIVVALYYAVTE
jgi:hypothetical protein